MIDAVAQQVDERILHLLQNAPIDFNLAALEHQLYLLALLAGQLAGEARENLEQRRERQQLHLLHIVQQAVSHTGQRAQIVLGGFFQFRQTVFERFDEALFDIQIFEQLADLLRALGGIVVLATLFA